VVRLVYKALSIPKGLHVAKKGGTIPKKGRADAKTGGTVSKKSIRTASGATITVRRLDGDSETFSDDFRYVFEKNVEKARRENKKLARGDAKGR
jgi:hypothetical protein